MMNETILPWLGLIVGGYFLGSIMFCRLICLIFYHTDICKVSKDKNPGAANAFWHCGKVAGVSGLLLDMLKGFLPVFVAIRYLSYDNFALFLVMLAPVLGHAFSVFHNFSGGKCIATIYGEFTALFFTMVSPLFLIVFGIMNLFFELFVKKLPGDKRAYIMFIALIAVSFFLAYSHEQISIATGVIAVSLVAILKHSPIFAVETKKSGRRKKASIAK